MCFYLWAEYLKPIAEEERRVEEAEKKAREEQERIYKQLSEGNIGPHPVYSHHSTCLLHKQRFNHPIKMTCQYYVHLIHSFLFSLQQIQTPSSNEPVPDLCRFVPNSIKWVFCVKIKTCLCSLFFGFIFNLILKHSETFNQLKTDEEGFGELFRLSFLFPWCNGQTSHPAGVFVYLSFSRRWARL